MSSAPLRTLVVGFGNIGSSIVRALASAEYRDRLSPALLVRPSSLQTEAKAAKVRSLQALGVELVHGDCDDPTAELAARLRGFHTVVSVVGGPSFRNGQLNLLEACRQAGVKRFIPSDWSVDTEAAGADHALSRLYDNKRPVTEALQSSESGLDYLRVTPGLYAELLFSPWGGVDIPNLTVTAPYSLDTRVTFTSTADIGRITAALLLSDDVHRGVVNISSDTLTFAEVADIIERATGKAVQRKVWAASDIDVAIAAPTPSVKAEAAKFLGEGKGAWWQRSASWNNQPAHRVATQTGAEILEALCAKQASL